MHEGWGCRRARSHAHPAVSDPCRGKRQAVPQIRRPMKNREDSSGNNFLRSVFLREANSTRKSLTDSLVICSRGSEPKRGSKYSRSRLMMARNR